MLIYCVKLDHALYSINYGISCYYNVHVYINFVHDIIHLMPYLSSLPSRPGPTLR